MLGLVVVLIGFIYLWLLRWAIREAGNFAFNKYGTTNAKKIGRVIGFLIVFLPVFWDVIPNRISFYSYCKNDTKLQVYKTFEEWIMENPNDLEVLEPLNSKDAQQKIYKDFFYNKTVLNYISYRARYANQRIVLYESDPYFEYLPFQIRRSSYVLYDNHKKEILAEINSYESGPGNIFGSGMPGYKIWLNQECENDDSRSMFAFAKLFNVL